MPTAITCAALTRDFGEVRAVDALSLEVPAGSVPQIFAAPDDAAGCYRNSMI